MPTIDTLDTTKNEAYDEVLGTIGIRCLKVYTGSIEFKTYVDEKFTGHEQRKDAWTNPRREWILEFEKTPDSARLLEWFFIKCKGRKKAFYWKWNRYDVDGLDLGGDDITYYVRFKEDKLEFNVLDMGYKTFKVVITQVMTQE